MAGSGYQLFSAGQVLTASDLQGFAVDQSMMVFANSAARTSALATPAEGMHSYLQDTDQIDVYDGTAWKIVYLPPTAYTPTATNWTRSSGQLYYSISGHTMTIQGKLTVSAVTGSMLISLPTGFTYNSTVVANGSVAGTSYMSVAGGFYTGLIQFGASNTFYLLAQGSAGNFTNGGLANANVPATWANGNTFTVSLQAMLS
jgi:hypothetical protein